MPSRSAVRRARASSSSPRRRRPDGHGRGPAVVELACGRATPACRRRRRAAAPRRSGSPPRGSWPSRAGQLAEVAVDRAVRGEQVADLDDEPAPPDQLLVHGRRARRGGRPRRRRRRSTTATRATARRAARRRSGRRAATSISARGLVVQAELGVHHGQRRPPRRPGTPEAGDRLDDRAGLVEATLLAPDAEQLHAVTARRRRPTATRVSSSASAASASASANRPSPMASRACAWRSRTWNNGWPTLVASRWWRAAVSLAAARSPARISP